MQPHLQDSKTHGFVAHTMQVTVALRGGHMTKVAGQAASFAPAIGMLMSGAASIAFGSAVTVTGATAGDCTGGGGTCICSKPVTAGDTTLAITNAGGVTATTEPGVGIDMSGTGGVPSR